jgi:hypothetical protein
VVPKRQRAGPNRAVVHCKSRFGNGASTSERGVLERELGTGIPPDKEPSDSNDRQSGPQKVGRMPEGRDLRIYPKQKTKLSDKEDAREAPRKASIWAFCQLAAVITEVNKH